MNLLIATLYVFRQHWFLPLGLPEVVPYYELKAHIWKILFFFLVGAVETEGYGEDKAKRALSGVWNGKNTWESG